MTSSVPDRAAPNRRWVRWSLVALALLVAAEVVARLATPLAQRAGFDTRRVEDLFDAQTAAIRERLADTADVIVLDPELGWRNRPGYRSALHDINAAGIRGTREYGPAAPAGLMRVATFGDAFVYGAEVPTAQSWGALLESARPGTEVLNFGVGGYGTDQAFLRYLREGRRSGAQVVLIGFSPIDLRRGTNRYTRFSSFDETPLTKPRFELAEDGSLRVLPNPLRSRADWEQVAARPERIVQAGRGDAWYDPLRFENPLFDRSAFVRLTVAVGTRLWRRFLWSERLEDGAGFRPTTEAFRVQRAVLRSFADSVRADRATPIIVLLPDSRSVWGQTPYDGLADSLRADGLTVVDVAPALGAHARANGGDGLFAPGGHYGPVGNQVVASHLAEALGSPTARERPAP